MRGYRTYIAFFVVAVVFYIITRTTGVQEVDWSPSFLGNDDRPFGCLIVREAMEGLFKAEGVKNVTMSAFNNLEGSEQGMAYVFVNEDFNPGDVDLRYLLQFAKRGNSIFIAANDLGRDVEDSLGVTIVRASEASGDSTALKILNPSLNTTERWSFRNALVDHEIDRFDTTRARVIAVNDRGRPVMVRVPFGKGEVLVSSAPYVYTNHALLLQRNGDFAWKTLSNVQGKPVIWDDYYKAGRTESSTPMRYFWSQPSLKGAFWIAFAGVILFVINMGRRRQRVIPVIPPPTNTTLEFVKTVGRLYYQNGDHRDLAAKKILFFLDHLRQRYGVSTIHRDERTIGVVSARSGVDNAIVKAAIEATVLPGSVLTIAPVDLLRTVNRAIEDFYQAEAAGGSISKGHA